MTCLQIKTDKQKKRALREHNMKREWHGRFIGIRLLNGNYRQFIDSLNFILKSKEWNSTRDEVLCNEVIKRHSCSLLSSEEKKNRIIYHKNTPIIKKFFLMCC